MKTQKPTEYTAPTFSRHALRMIALGGTTGPGDSQPANTAPQPASVADSTEEWEEDFNENPPNY